MEKRTTQQATIQAHLQNDEKFGWGYQDRLRLDRADGTNLFVYRKSSFQESSCFEFSGLSPDVVQDFSAKVIQLSEIQSIGKKIERSNISPHAGIKSRMNFLSDVEQYIDNEMQTRINGSARVGSISAVEATRRSGLNYIVIDLDPETEDVIKNERLSFFGNFKSKDILKNHRDPIIAFAVIGVSGIARAQEVYKQLLESDIIGRSIELSPAMPEIPITRL